MEQGKVGNLVSKLIIDGDGTKFLSDNGNYVVNSSGDSIDDLSISETTTYSSTKIASITGDINDINLPVSLKGLSLVDMAKVNFSSANEAKALMINGVGDTSLAPTNTFTEISNSLLSKKQSIVNALASKNILAYQYDDIVDYATDINNIVQTSTIKSIQVNKTSGQTSVVTLTNPISIQNISTSVLEYVAGSSGVVKYNCNFNSGDATGFTIGSSYVVLDGKMKQSNNSTPTTMTSGTAIGIYTPYSATVNKTLFNKIEAISEASNILTISGTYPIALVQANSDISLLGVSSITDITWTSTTTNTSKILLIYSLDSGTTWKGYDSTNHVSLAITSIADLSEVKTKAITPTSLNAFTQTDLNNMRNGSAKIRFAYYIEKNATTDTLESDSITLTADMTGQDIFSTHYTVAFDGTKILTYTFSADKTYTIIYTDN